MQTTGSCMTEVNRSTQSDRLRDLESTMEARSFDPCRRVDVLRRLTEVWTKPLRWVWKDLIPQGKLTFVTGESGVGKSWFALQAAAMATRGHLTPDADVPVQQVDAERRQVENESGLVLLFSANDDLHDTVWPRLESLGADQSKIFVASNDAVLGLRCEFDTAENNQAVEPNSLEQSLNKLDDALAQIAGIEGNLKLIIIDSIDSYLDAAGTHANRLKLLSRLVRLAATSHAAVLVIADSTQGAVGKAKARIYDEFAHVGRSVLTVVQDLECPERRLVMPVKTNLIERPPGARFQFRGGKLEWSSKTTHLNSEQYLALAREKQKNPLIREERYEIQRASNWLRNRLIEGSAPSLEVRADADKNNIAYSTLRRAFKALGCRALRLRGFSCWYWRLPGNQSDWTLAPDMPVNEDDLVDKQYAGIVSREEDRKDFESEEAASMREVSVKNEKHGEAVVDEDRLTGAFPEDREAPPAPEIGVRFVDKGGKDAQDVHHEERDLLCSVT